MSLIYNESELTLTRTETPTGDFVGYDESERSSDIVFSTTIFFPTNPSDGIIYEAGGNILGAWVGITNGGTNLRARAGDGRVTGEVSTTYMAVVNTPNFPKDNQKHVLSWEFRVNPGRVRVFIDGELVGVGETTSNLPLANSDDPSLEFWAGFARGAILSALSGQNSGAPTGELTTPGYIALDGTETLRVYTNQLFVGVELSPINLGEVNISKIYLGSTEITKAYLGSNEVYSIAPPVISPWVKQYEETTSLLTIARDIEVSPDDRFVYTYIYSSATLGQRRLLKLDATNGDIVLNVSTGDIIDARRIALSPDGSKIYYSGVRKIASFNTSDFSQNWFYSDNFYEAFRIKVTPDGSKLLWVTNNRVFAQNTSNGSIAWTNFNHNQGAVIALAVSTNGFVYTAEFSGNLFRLNESNGSVSQEQDPGYTGIRCLVVSPDNNTLYIGTSSGKVVQLSTSTLTLSGWDITPFTGNVDDFALTSDGNYLFAASITESIVKKINVSNGTVVSTYSVNTGNIEDIHLSSDDNYLFIGAEDKTIRVIQV
jgi:RNase P/RNase MRP subunit p29